MLAINKAGTGVNLNQISLDPPSLAASKITTKQQLNSLVPIQASLSERSSKTAELAQTSAQIKEKVTTAFAQQTARSGVNSVQNNSAEPTAQALRLVDVRGTANEADKRLVAAELSKLQPDILQRLENNKTRVVVCRNSVTEVLTELKNVKPRGWPAGKSWDTVPGLFHPQTNRVIVATRGHNTPEGAHVPKSGDGHGSFNLVIHETMHGLDYRSTPAKLSTSLNFTKARNADLATLDPYEKQSGNAGPEEAFAESAARYYGGDSTDAIRHPKLHGYWAANPLDAKNPRP